MTANDLARSAIAAWHRADMQACEADLKCLMATYPSTWDVALVDLQPPREMMRRMISLVTRDGKPCAVISDKGALSS